MLTMKPYNFISNIVNNIFSFTKTKNFIDKASGIE
jgi:hypothetical protein